MALHTCRDFLTAGNPLNLFTPWLCQYYLAIFCRVVLGYTVVGQTNFNIDGSTLRLGNGANGSLNQGLGNEYAFIPNGYVVTANDLGRILAVKSPNNPMVNSGMFRVTGVDTTNNYLFINYRSGDIPPAETGMTWGLYEYETVFNSLINFTGNGIVNTYQGQGTATQSRIVLLSPSSLGWQLRLAFENSYDTPQSNGNVSPSAGFSNGATVAPGFGGTVAGDFLPGGPHLHYPLWLNKHTLQGLGLSMGFFPANTNQCRIYMWGDDSTGTLFATARAVVGGGTDSMIHFGLAEDEEQPLPPKAVQRLFVMGANGVSNGANNGAYWACGANATFGRCGASYGLSNSPISCIYSLYNPFFGSTFGGIGGNNAIRNVPNASDNQYIAATELIPVDLLAGTLDELDSYDGSGEVFVLEGRRLGRAPFVRNGRSNYGYYQVSTDSQHAWLHINDGIYAPWQGSILP